jgi:hypothetical protein
MRRDHFEADRTVENRYSVKQLLFELVYLAREILREMRVSNQTPVTGGEIRRIGNIAMGTTLPTLGPGVTATFEVTPTPAGVVTIAKNAVWSSSDPANFPAVQDPTDTTGNTADVTIPQSDTGTENVTLTWTYTNADGTVATASAVFDLVGGTVAAVDVTGGTIARIS